MSTSGLYTHRTRYAGEIVTDVLYNTAHENQRVNDVPNEAGAAGNGDLTSFRATQDPAPGGVVNQVAALTAELQQLRFSLADIKTALNGGTPLAQWYTPVSIPAGVQVGRGARVFRNTTQAISFKTQTAVVMTTVRYDTGVTNPAVDPFFSLANPTRLTAKTAGLFQIGGTVRFALGAGTVAAFIRLNGSKLLCAKEWSADGAQDPWLNISTQYELAATDYVELVVFQEATNPLNVINPEFGLELLNPTAVIAPPTTHLLMVAEIGTGAGTITSDIGGINCPGVCSQLYGDGVVVNLTATPSVGSFVQWTGDVPVGHETDNPLAVTMNQARNINAQFTAYTLTITENGTGAGIVTSDVGGINCPGTCSAQYSVGQVVNLTATPTVGTFTGWTGDVVSSSNPVAVTMNADKNVIATFMLTGVIATFNSSVGNFTGTRYASITSNAAVSTTAAAVAWEAPSAVTLTQISVLLSAVLAGGHSMTFQLNVNGVDTGPILTLTAGQQFGSLALAIAIAQKDQVAIKMVQTGGGGDTFNTIALAYTA